MPYLDRYSNLHSWAGGATRTGVGGSRAAEDLGRALAEVDGLFAGFIHLDETEPESGTRLRRDHQDNLALELDSLCTTAPASNLPDSQPYNPDRNVQARENAWSSIRTVRDGMQALWEHFVDVAQDLNLPAINYILTEYQDAKGLRQAGVFAFRNTLTGPSPNDLTKIFAFCSLSYVVSRLLCARGRLAKDDILAGVRLWLDALGREDEREAFKKLAERLWPEARDHLHRFDLGFSEATQKLATSLRRGGTPFSVPSTYTSSTAPNTTGLGLQSSPMYNQPAQAYPYQQTSPSNFGLALESDAIDPSLLNTQARDNSFDYAQQLFGGLANEEFNFAAMLPAPPASLPNPQPAPWQWHDWGPGQPLDFNISSLGGTTPWSTVHQSNAGSPIAISSSQEPYDRSLSSTPTSVDTLKLLQTSVFTAVLRYVRENRDFWYDLAGRGLASKDFRSLFAWGQERSRKKKHIQASYIQPLLSKKDDRDLASRGIVSVVETFFDLGLLQSIEDIKHYMNRVANLLFDDQESYRQFCDWAWDIREASRPPTYSSKPSTNKRNHLSCHLCKYTSNRSSNMKRHYTTVHQKDEENNKTKKSRRFS